MSKQFRKTSQPLLPLQKSTVDSPYVIYPSYPTGANKIRAGFPSLANEIIKHKTTIIDGFGGVLWGVFVENLKTALAETGKKVSFFNCAEALKSEPAIARLTEGSLNGNDPVFGKKYEGELIDFFDPKKLNLIKADSQSAINIIYGTGASLAGWNGFLIYLDVPKNEIQYRMRSKSITNLGAKEAGENTQMYKRFYFVDWVVQNKHKRKLLPTLDVIADEQRIDNIVWMKGRDFREALDAMSKNAFRARPWFEAGVWGGDWMKKKLHGLAQNEVNYAWSFELITPENGIVLESSGLLLEASFDFLMYRNAAAVLGKAEKRFGAEFPIRFDFLDTFRGGNLSIQCHPRPRYIKEKFGENFTQDETYYILDCEPGAHVYLGFQEGIEKEKFKNALTEAQQTGKEIDIVEYVQRFPAYKHDLFLIPNGTVHASGKNNLVLEISSTPYIFTFKMYDWQRLDLTGKPRPINIEHAMSNLYFDRKGKYVSENLISRTQLLEVKPNYKLYQLTTHPEHFYAVQRVEFTGDVRLSTRGQCQVCMLVEGEKIEVITQGSRQVFNYAETFVVPAAAANFELRNPSQALAKVVLAYVKDEA